MGNNDKVLDIHQSEITALREAFVDFALENQEERSELKIAIQNIRNRLEKIEDKIPAEFKNEFNKMNNRLSQIENKISPKEKEPEIKSRLLKFINNHPKIAYAVGIISVVLFAKFILWLVSLDPHNMDHWLIRLLHKMDGLL